ncbi:Metallo-beta-lactamase domain-containing protein 1 [Manis javanica]|nr:Metallo-beta-lactamase domain-containing protein 1 [Manis javanica]
MYGLATAAALLREDTFAEYRGAVGKQADGGIQHVVPGRSLGQTLLKTDFFQRTGRFGAWRGLESPSWKRHSWMRNLKHSNGWRDSG